MTYFNSTPDRRQLFSACVLGLAALAGVASLPATAQTAWPTKPVKIIVGFPAGGPLDAHARLLADKLAAQLGQPVIIAHERTPFTEAALRSQAIDALITQDPGHLVRSAIRILRAACDGRAVLVVASGETRISHAKFKEIYGKGKMLKAEEVVELTGHPVGGVCPFGLATEMPVYLDVSLQKFDVVLPAAGAVNNAVRVKVALLAGVTLGKWVDVC